MMVVLSQTGLTVVVAKGEGDSPIKSIGIVLCHLQHICHQMVSTRAQIWNLRVRQKAEEAVGPYLEEIAHREGTTVQGLVEAHRLPPAELERKRDS